MEISDGFQIIFHFHISEEFGYFQYSIKHVKFMTYLLLWYVFCCLQIWNKLQKWSKMVKKIPIVAINNVFCYLIELKLFIQFGFISDNKIRLNPKNSTASTINCFELSTDWVIGMIFDQIFLYLSVHLMASEFFFRHTVKCWG